MGNLSRGKLIVSLAFTYPLSTRQQCISIATFCTGNKTSPDYWMGADLRTRMTFDASHPVIGRITKVAETFATSSKIYFQKSTGEWAVEQIKSIALRIPNVSPLQLIRILKNFLIIITSIVF